MNYITIFLINISSTIFVIIALVVYSFISLESYNMISGTFLIKKNKKIFNGNEFLCTRL